MPFSTEDLNTQSDALRGMLADQGTRLRKIVASSLDAFFTADSEKARVVIELDDQIDETDVEIERRAVALLTRVANEATPCDDRPLRGLLTLVKVNNEYERIADSGVDIAHRAIELSGSPAAFPPTTRVMTNSVLGMLRDTTKAYDKQDATLARLVLQSESMVLTFKAEIMRAAEQAVASGEMPVDLAFDLHEIAGQCVLMADHATNVAEQVIWESTGVIVRHRAGEWIEESARKEIAKDEAAKDRAARNGGK